MADFECFKWLSARQIVGGIHYEPSHGALFEVLENAHLQRLSQKIQRSADKGGKATATDERQRGPSSGNHFETRSRRERGEGRPLDRPSPLCRPGTCPRRASYLLQLPVELGGSEGVHLGEVPPQQEHQAAVVDVERVVMAVHLWNRSRIHARQSTKVHQGPPKSSVLHRHGTNDGSSLNIQSHDQKMASFMWQRDRIKTPKQMFEFIDSNRK